jgi:hypothetical protein
LEARMEHESCFGVSDAAPLFGGPAWCGARSGSNFVGDQLNLASAVSAATTICPVAANTDCPLMATSPRCVTAPSEECVAGPGPIGT